MIVFREIFLRPSTSIGNIALKVTVFLLCVFLVVLGTSICMLCCLYPGDEDFADSSTDGYTYIFIACSAMHFFTFYLFNVGLMWIEVNYLRM